MRAIEGTGLYHGCRVLGFYFRRTRRARIKNVGHEPDNATAEVRRSLDGIDGPLYQAAYMLGALQFRALHKELVFDGHMTNREFHDVILQENSIPVEMIRAKLMNQKLTPDFKSSWKFYGPNLNENPN